MSPVPVACFEIQTTSRQEIYVFIKSFTDTDFCDQPLTVDIDPIDGGMRFYTALQTIIDDTDIPMYMRIQADSMFQSEHIRDL